MKKRNLKALYNLNTYIDEESQKLSDKVKNLQLSHNRIRKLLKMCLNHVDSLFSGRFITWDELHFLHKRLTLELYGLEGYKEPLVVYRRDGFVDNVEVKGGKK